MLADIGPPPCRAHQAWTLRTAVRQAESAASTCDKNAQKVIRGVKSRSLSRAPGGGVPAAIGDQPAEEGPQLAQGLGPIGANLRLIYGLFKVGYGCLNRFKTAKNRFKLALMDLAPSTSGGRWGRARRAVRPNSKA